MIATVRIAPVARWCHWYEKGKGHPGAQKIAGLPIQIETLSMRTAQCNESAKMWDMTPESNAMIEEISGIKSDYEINRGVCEHFLEMD